jgi:hypothetical protein
MDMDKINGTVMAAGQLEVLGGSTGILMGVAAGEFRAAKRNFVGQRVVVVLEDEVQQIKREIVAEEKPIGWKMLNNADLPKRGDLILVRYVGANKPDYQEPLVVENSHDWWVLNANFVRFFRNNREFSGTKVSSTDVIEWMKIGTVQL